MKFLPTNIADVYILEPEVYGDNRGYFMETFREVYFRREGIDVRFVQDNSSLSGKGTIRGLHYQAGDAVQAKLMMVSRGVILDVAVDLRQRSNTYGKHVSVLLSEDNHRQLYIPEGFAHGFAVLSHEAVIHYKCSRYYDPERERGLRWNDPYLGIDWMVTDPVLSEKDRIQPLFNELRPGDLF
ncbi:MAG: dTDP-4-dehydrorhamnose 3,5-epimerase [Balneolaceae bacterium]